MMENQAEKVLCSGYGRKLASWVQVLPGPIAGRVRQLHLSLSLPICKMGAIIICSRNLLLC